jgi:hypothetical protein
MRERAGLGEVGLLGARGRHELLVRGKRAELLLALRTVSCPVEISK